MDELFNFQKSALLGDISGTPLCQEYKKEWSQCGNDKTALVKFALRQQSQPFFLTACHQGKGLTKDYIKENFGSYINGYTVHDADNVSGYTYGLYVDYDYDNDLVADKDVCSIMWTIGSTVVIPQSKCPVIYISNRSKVHLVGEGFNSVRIYLFDESEVTLEDLDENSSVLIYKYSDDAKVEIGKFCLTTKVKCFDKQLKL